MTELHARAKQVLGEKIPEMERKFNEDTQSYMDQLEVTFAEEQLQLKVRQWNEIAAACGMASPDKALQKYQQRMAQRASDEAEDELVKFRQDREAEAQRVREKLEKEKQEYDQKIKAEMEKMNREQEVQPPRAAMMEELRKEKDRKEQSCVRLVLPARTDVKGPTARRVEMSAACWRSTRRANAASGAGRAGARAPAGQLDDQLRQAREAEGCHGAQQAGRLSLRRQWRRPSAAATVRVGQLSLRAQR